MPKDKLITIDGLGPVAFRKKRGARHVCIAVEPFAPIQVSVPYWVSFARAREVLDEKMRWVRRQLAKMEEMEAAHTAHLSRVVAEDTLVVKTHISKRVAELARHCGFTYNNVCIRNQKTRWGSCSYHNNINLNINLTHLPDELRDYVILHELAHTKIKDHSKKFWELLDSLVGNAKHFDAQLRKYPLRLFARAREERRTRDEG